MARILAAFAFLLIAFFAKTASACDIGDKRLGPNCVHTEWLEPTLYSDYETPFPITTVYRVREGSARVIVWEGNGVVVESSLKFLRTVLDVKLKGIDHMLHMEETFKWRTTTYAK